MPSFPSLVAKNSRIVLDALLRPKNARSSLWILVAWSSHAFRRPLVRQRRDERSAPSLDGFDVLEGTMLTLYCPHDLVVPYGILMQVPVRRDPNIGILSAPASAYELIKPRLREIAASGEPSWRAHSRTSLGANESLVRWREPDFYSI